MLAASCTLFKGSFKVLHEGVVTTSQGLFWSLWLVSEGASDPIAFPKIALLLKIETAGSLFESGII